MNVTASKVLLALSVAAYVYCTWDHLSPTKKADAAPNKPIALTAAMVNHVEVLHLGRDVFESKLIDRGVGDASALPGDDASDADGTSGGAAAAATADASGSAAASAEPASMFSLQGVFMSPDGHTALINGTPVTEGEVATIGVGGPKISVTKIGEDYAMIVSRGRTIVLKLSDPPVAGASGAGSNVSSGSSGTSSNNSSSANSSPSPGTSRNGYSDPYAGHRTGHH